MKFDTKLVCGFFMSLFALSMIGAGFFIGDMGWWSIIYIGVVILYLGYQESIWSRFEAEDLPSQP